MKKAVLQSIATIRLTKMRASAQLERTIHDKAKPQLNIKVIKEKKVNDFIPCMLMKHEGGSAKLFLYFHANAEDLGRAYKFLTFVHNYLKMHVMSVEYPGYGVYET